MSSIVKNSEKTYSLTESEIRELVRRSENHYSPTKEEEGVKVNLTFPSLLVLVVIASVVYIFTTILSNSHTENIAKITTSLAVSGFATINATANGDRPTVRMGVHSQIGSGNNIVRFDSDGRQID